ncbi:hypothetical protein ACR2V7_25730, partial [Klebsiella pneumoniae]
IAGDETVAEVYRETAWKPKFEVEKEKQKAEEAAAGDTDGLKGYQKVVFDVLYQIADIPFLSEHKAKILNVIEKAEKQPNLTIGVIVSVVVIIFTVLFKLLFGGKKPAKVSAGTSNTEVAETSDNQGGSEEKEQDEQDDKEDETATRRRRPKRVN